MFRRSSRRRTCTAAAGLAVALALAACSNSSSSTASSSTTSNGPTTTFAGTSFTEDVPVSAPGVSNTEIHVGSITSRTNPVGGDNGILDDGIKAYFDVVNSKGGIWGRKLKLTSERDDQTGNNQSETQAMLSQDNVYAVFEAVLLFTGAPLLAQAGIPTFGWNINAEWAGPKNFYPNVGPICFGAGCETLGRFPEWVAQQEHRRRIAVMAYSVPQSSAAIKGAIASIKQFGKDVGAQLAFSDVALQFGQLDYSAQVSQMKAKKVDMLITALDFNGDYAIAKEMQRQGIRDKVVFVHPNLYNRDFVAKYGKLFEGDVVLVPILASEHTTVPPALAEYLAYARSHGLKVTEMTEEGWFAARQFVEALKAAGPHFTWANLEAAWNRQKWFSNGGVVPPIDWTVQHHNPADGARYHSQFECVNFVRIHDSHFVGLWDAGGKKPWVCFDGKKPNEWEHPVNLSFAGAPLAITDVMRQR
jgi:ABC-type branched-subunit amino acid transport system substrate-binding protein